MTGWSFASFLALMKIMSQSLTEHWRRRVRSAARFISLEYCGRLYQLLPPEHLRSLERKEGRRNSCLYSYFKAAYPVCGDSVQKTFLSPTHDTELFLKAAFSEVETMYRVEILYAKAGIMSFDLAWTLNVQGGR